MRNIFVRFLALCLLSQDDPAAGLLCVGSRGRPRAVGVSSNKKLRELREAKASYQASLAKLKSNPTNPDLKQRTQLGRIYSNLTRRKRGVTIFDEVALMNDINAACAGATLIAASFGEAKKCRLE